MSSAVLLEWRLRCALVLALVACSSKPKNEPASEQEQAGSAAAGKAALAKTDGAPARKASRENPRDRKAVNDLVDGWLEAQNRGDLNAYSAFYGEGFVGIRRSGEKTVELDRAGWLADRKRMFAKPMTVLAEHRLISIDGERARVEFLQTWSSGSYKDRGPKAMDIALGKAPRILREELLSSTILMSEQAALDALFPDDPDKSSGSELQCIPIEDDKNTWACVASLRKTDDGPSAQGEVALLRRVDKVWAVLDRSDLSIAGKSAGIYTEDPSTVAESASIRLRGLVEIGPKEQALEVSLEAESMQTEDAGITHRARESHLYWIDSDTLQLVVSVESSWELDAETDKASTEEYEILSQVHEGFFDVSITRHEEEHQWPVDGHTESSEVEVQRWSDGSYQAE